MLEKLKVHECKHMKNIERQNMLEFSSSCHQLQINDLKQKTDNNYNTCFTQLICLRKLIKSATDTMPLQHDVMDLNDLTYLAPLMNFGTVLTSNSEQAFKSITLEIL